MKKGNSPSQYGWPQWRQCIKQKKMQKEAKDIKNKCLYFLYFSPETLVDVTPSRAGRLLQHREKEFRQLKLRLEQPSAPDPQPRCSCGSAGFPTSGGCTSVSERLHVWHCLPQTNCQNLWLAAIFCCHFLRKPAWQRPVQNELSGYIEYQAS